jgi:DNA-binding transcriptional LysR family regulator
MTLPLHQLRLFNAVAERRGFSRAAEALRISQPAVSKGVRELEEQVGAALLERGPGGVRLTDAGTVLAARARELFAIERAAEEEMRALRGLERGSLRIGASTTIATYHLPPVLAAFQARHPGVVLRLTSANTWAILDLLARREIDAALVEGPVDDAAFTVTPWREEKMLFVAAPAHRLLRRGAAASATDLAEEIFVVREPGSGTREVVERVLARAGIVPARTLEVGSTEAIKQVVAAGLGVAVVSATAAADQIALGRLAPLPTVSGEHVRMLSRVAIPGRRPSPPGRAFARLLDAAADAATPPAPAAASARPARS